MRTINKYGLMDTAEQFVQMPRGAAVLTIQAQRGYPTLWAEVDTIAPEVRRRFIRVETGHVGGTEGLVYVASVQVEDGDYVVHFYTDQKEYPLE